MIVILQEKIANLGGVGDKVNVKAGYARNYLIPFNKAMAATTRNIAEFEKRRAEFEKKAELVLGEAKERAEKLKGFSVKIAVQASDEGKLYGSVGPREIASAITEEGIEVEKSEVIMHEGALRTVGEFEVIVRLHSEVDTTVKVNVIPA